MSDIKTCIQSWWLGLTSAPELDCSSYKSLYNSYEAIHKQDIRYYKTVAKIALFAAGLTAVIFIGLLVLGKISFSANKLIYPAMGLAWQLLLWAITEEEKISTRRQLLNSLKDKFETMPDTTGHPDYKTMLLDIVKKHSLL